jgi:plastocyanin
MKESTYKYRLRSASLMIVLLSLCGLARAQNKEVELTVTAKQFEFAPRVITVHKGARVKLTLKSEDVMHGFAIDEFKINQRVSPDEPSVVSFTADREGRFRFYCSVVCGDDHDKMTGELVVAPEQGSDQGAAPSNIQVAFDQTDPNIVIVESAGQRVRIDTRTKSVTNLEPQAALRPQPTPPAVASAAQETHPRPGTEPYDYRLVNLPTPKSVPKHSVNLYFTHRFSEVIGPEPGETSGQHLSRISNDLLGLDSFSVSSFGFSYGITDRLYAFVYRSPICQTGLCKTIELGLGYHLLDEAGKSPMALSVQASVEGDYNFTERYVENLQVMMERSISKYAHVFFSPAVHINSNGEGRFDPQPQNFFPPPTAVAASFRLGQNSGSLGFGADARIRPTVSLVFEFTPSVGFKLGNVAPIINQAGTIVGFQNQYEPEIGFGIQKRIGKHVFTLAFTNTQGTTSSRYQTSTLFVPPSNYVIGFNIYRRLM